MRKLGKKTPKGNKFDIDKFVNTLKDFKYHTMSIQEI